MIARVRPAMIDGSPRPRLWSSSLNQFQLLAKLADRGWSG